MNFREDQAPDPNATLAGPATLSHGLTCIWLGLLTWGVLSELLHSDRAHRPVGFVLLAAAVASAIVALLLRRERSPESSVAVVVLAASGGALVAFAPLAMVFPAVAVLSATVRWRIPVASWVAAVGWASTVVSAVALGSPAGAVLGCLAAILGGALVGLTRRQATERAEQAARAEVEVARTEIERERAELLAERNHLGRELHDVLAHTLAALAVQLEAFGTVVDADPATSAAVRDQLERSRRLVREGLDEARRAVRALRDDATPFDDQLRSLAELHNAEFTEHGPPRQLPAPVVAGIYRVAQEALTNVAKHATGAPTTLTLWREPGRVSVVIENDGAEGSRELHESGGGYGLRGIAERLALLGGCVEAGPTVTGWRVRANVPVPATDPHRSVTR